MGWRISNHCLEHIRWVTNTTRPTPSSSMRAGPTLSSMHVSPSPTSNPRLTSRLKLRYNGVAPITRSAFCPCYIRKDEQRAQWKREHTKTILKRNVIYTWWNNVGQYNIYKQRNCSHDTYKLRKHKGVWSICSETTKYFRPPMQVPHDSITIMRKTWFHLTSLHNNWWILQLQAQDLVSCPQ